MVSKTNKIMTEIWKDIEGFEGAYQISNLGNLKSLARIVKNGRGFRKVGERILKPVVGTCGYYQYPLKQGNKHKTILIHIEVAKAFIYNPYSYIEVNHKDENRLNNSVSNLEWCTRQYNNTYLKRKQREIETQQNTHPSNKKIQQYTKNGVLIKEYQSLREAERETKINHSNISDCINNKRKSAGGFIWLVSNQGYGYQRGT